MRPVRLVSTTGQELRIDSRSKSKASKPKKEGSSYTMSNADQLTAKLVVEHNVSMNHATEIMDAFDATYWSDKASMRRLRRVAIRLLGEPDGGKVFGFLRMNSPAE